MNDAELVEKVRDLITPPEDDESWLNRVCRDADASASLAEMRFEMARVLLAQSAEIERLRAALEPVAALTFLEEGPLGQPVPRLHDAEIIKCARTTLERWG